MPDMTRPCETHPDLVKFRYPLPHFREALRHQRKIKVVAIGSSSTAGVAPVLPYPPRLEMLLRHKFYGRMIDVLNRGISGQESPEELSRLETDVIDEVPVLVVWQVGTNAVYRNISYNPDEVGEAIAVGLEWLAGLPIDVVLMDLQYTKALFDQLERSTSMVQRIAAVGEKAGVNVFNRFALMKRWVDDGAPILDMDDGADSHLHTSEWATNCLTQALFESIARAVEEAGVT
jgi:acyl-CoA thioesterase-1